MVLINSKRTKHDYILTTFYSLWFDVIFFLLLKVVAIAADLTPERYWSTALPNTPIPNSLHNLLTFG